MCFNKAIIQSMFKHVASENGPLVLILESYSQIFIVTMVPVLEKISHFFFTISKKNLL